MNENLNGLIKAYLKNSNELVENINERKALDNEYSKITKNKSLKDLLSYHNSSEYSTLNEKQNKNYIKYDHCMIKKELLLNNIYYSLSAAAHEWEKENDGKIFRYKATQKSINEYLTAAAGYKVEANEGRSDDITAYIYCDAQYYIKIAALTYLHGDAVNYNENKMIHNVISYKDTNKLTNMIYNTLKKQNEFLKAALEKNKDINNELNLIGGANYAQTSIAPFILKSTGLLTIK